MLLTPLQLNRWQLASSSDYRRLLLPCLAAGLFATAAAAQAEQADSDSQALRQALSLCQQERSALLRLDCYDQAMKPAENSQQTLTLLRSENAQLAINQEAARGEHTTEFLTLIDNEGDRRVVITTPALGLQPPRPILSFSCVDNITRMQVILYSPSSEMSSAVTLKTNQGKKLSTHWFIRDGGYITESSRGLPGIAEIQQLFNADTLTIESENHAINGLTFNITGLAQAIVPLRSACRW